ncbi:MAG: hypothetical protein JNJ52_00470 [Flavobacterium sp.]|nr:hypothetical protein [Flavobacterium sp.]
MFTLTKRFYAILAIVLILLLIPLVAMQFTNEVNWSVFDFIAAGILLLGTGLAIEIVLQKVKSRKNRILISGIIIILLLLLWGELAVGIFGSPVAGN